MTQDKTNKVSNVPPLRFPEFSGEWEKTTIDNLAEVIGGGTPETNNQEYWSGDIIWYTPSEIGKKKYISDSQRHISKKGLENSSAKMLPAGTILLSTRATIGECSITLNSCTTNQGFQSLIARDEVNNEYLYYLIISKRKDLIRRACGSTFLEISANEVKKINVSATTIDEQNKLASFLALIDQRIETQIRVIEDLQTLKKAIIERSYNVGGEAHKIGELIEQVSKRNRSNNFPVLSVNNRLGFIEQADQFEDRTVASDDTSNYKVVSTNDFAYNPARINVGSIARLKNRTNGIVSPMYVCFHTKGSLLPEYMEHFFDTTYFKHEMFKRLEGSVRLCLSYEGLCNISMSIPSIEEQKKLSNHLSAIEQKIQIESKILEAYKMQKSYLLQQMFI